MKERILFIAPKFYNYHTLIRDKLKKNLNSEVDYYQDKRINILYSFLNALDIGLTKQYQNIYYFFLWIKIRKKKYSYLFVIKGDDIPISFILKLKNKNLEIKTIMYQWDSIEKVPYIKFLPYFDKVFTFDYRDFKKNKKLAFLQLFYTEDIMKIGKLKSKPNIDFFYISSFTKERYNFLKKIINYCKENDYMLKYYFYIPISTYIKYKYFKGVNLSLKYLSFKPMDRGNYIDCLKNSSVVVDYNHSYQTGLSMRVIEAYGANRKVLSTNPFIMNDPISSNTWVSILNHKSIDFTEYVTNNEVKENKKKLYLDNWLKCLFENEDSN